MLFETVLITWCAEKVKAEQCKPTLMCNIEKMGNELWTVRLENDSTIDIHVGQTESIVKVDEDDHHDFVNSFTFQRKDNIVMDLAADVFAEFNKIVAFCPEDQDTLLEQFLVDLAAIRKASEDEKE